MQITGSFYSLNLDLVTNTVKIMTWTDDTEQILPLFCLCVSTVVEKLLRFEAVSIPAPGLPDLAALVCSPACSS